MNNNSKKRPPPPSSAKQNQQKHHAAAAVEEEEMDEDVFLDETLILQGEEEALVLRDIEEQEALASRLHKWKRPALSQPYLSQSKNIGILQQTN